MKRLFVLTVSAMIMAISATASPPAAREACKQFIDRSGYRASEWGEYWDWPTHDNKDGTWTVVARFLGYPPGGNMTNIAVVCTTKKRGDQWSLEALKRMQ